jgi:hypothetical protein
VPASAVEQFGQRRFPAGVSNTYSLSTRTIGSSGSIHARNTSSLGASKTLVMVSSLIEASFLPVSQVLYVASPRCQTLNGGCAGRPCSLGCGG